MPFQQPGMPDSVGPMPAGGPGPGMGAGGAAAAPPPPQFGQPAMQPAGVGGVPGGGGGGFEAAAGVGGADAGSSSSSGGSWWSWLTGSEEPKAPEPTPIQTFHDEGFVPPPVHSSGPEGFTHK